MLNYFKKNKKDYNNQEATENLSCILDTINDCFLTASNDFKNVHVEKSDLTNKIVKVKNYTGIIEKEFTILNKRCLAIDVGEIHETEHVIEVDLDNETFKGIIVKCDDSGFKEIGKCLQYFGESKFIDISKGCHLRTKNIAIDEKYVYIKKSSPRIYAICLQIVQINCVECMQIKKSIKYDHSEQHYVKMSDIKVIANFHSIQFHNQVIIKPDFIFKYEKITHPSLKLKDEVQFKDLTEKIYRGEILWIGKVNEDVSAAIVSLNKSSLTDTIKQNELDETTMLTHFKVNKCGIFVAPFAINSDVITYKSCKKSNLEVVDPTIIHPFQKDPFKEKILVFKLNDELNAVKLKWKGRIYNQLCMGCELSYESEEGSVGQYGNEKLFDCASKRGVIITSEKVADQKITDLCEFTNVHNNLQFISTKDGFKIYDQTSICCIEKLDGIDLGKKNLKIGCKIMYQDKFIGICKFIGKVNSKSSVAIKLNLDDINEIPVVSDFINFSVFEKKKLCFVDLETLDIGTFYKADSSAVLSNSYNRHSSSTIVTYHPGNDPNKSFPCKVKWSGIHDNGNAVCGIELESEIMANSSHYFLENLFVYKTNRGIIDDDYKIESIVSMETAGNSILTESSEDYSKNCKKIIQSVLKGEVTEVINELIKHFPTDFINYVKENKEIMFRPKNLEQIFNSLYEKNKIELINDILASIENMKEKFSALESLLSKCIGEKNFGLIHEILSAVEKFQPNDDNNNQICLNLAKKCLENMTPENQSNLEIYKLFIELCGNYNCYIDNKDSKETFITKIILNGSISENVLIDVLKSKNFDINQQNSNGKSPMELAIDECRPNILKALFKLELLNTDKLQSIYDKLMENLTSHKPETLEIISIIKPQLDKMNSKANSTCGTKEPGYSNR